MNVRCARLGLCVRPIAVLPSNALPAAQPTFADGESAFWPFARQFVIAGTGELEALTAHL